MVTICLPPFCGRAPQLGTLKDILSNAVEMDVCFRRGQVLGNMGGMLLSYGVREKGEISLFIRGNFMGNLRYM